MFFIKRKIKDTNKLTFIFQYTKYGTYSEIDKYKILSLDSILCKFRKVIQPKYTATIKTEFNNIHYAMFDLDNFEKLNLFKSIFNDDAYVIFESSDDHYWAFLDRPYKKIDDIFSYFNWKICNDDKYVGMCIKSNMIIIRVLYETFDRKPHQIENNGILSDNFKLFILAIEDYFNAEGFELSVLRY